MAARFRILDARKEGLFLTKDLELIRRQLYEGLDLMMADLDISDLLMISTPM